MLVTCAHTWNPKAPEMTEKESLAARQKFMKDLMAKKVPVKNRHSIFNWEQGKVWWVWETEAQGFLG